MPSQEDDRLAALAAQNILDTPPEEQFDRITRIASRLLDAPISLVSLVDRERQWFKSRHGLDATETAREVAFCSHTIASDEVMVVEDATNDPRFATNPLVTEFPNIRFYAGAPLQDKDGFNLGTLCVIDLVPKTIDEEEKALLLDLAELVARELELRRMAMIDQLTGARNRHCLVETGSAELARANRYGYPFSLIVVDVDEFKGVNDRFGHDTGDLVLKSLVLCCQELLRAQDLVFRHGGDEFAILLPHTNACDAAEAAERIRDHVSAIDVPLDGGQTASFTVSLGVASRINENDTLDALLVRGDRALYDAKASGRNTVVTGEAA